LAHGVIFSETELKGAYVIDLEKRVDERGYFARSWCREEFDRHGLITEFVQHSVSFSEAAGTLRGLHFQRPPYGEVKLVRCMRGAIYDVIIDLRTDSRTFGRWTSVELNAESGRMLYIPALFAHGFQTLAPETEVSYMISTFHQPEAGEGLRYDDPQLGIYWPLPVSRIAEKDRSWPDFAELRLSLADARTRRPLAELTR
jgi:dTDP-4-dehydrorhamnose 3,5-epimerase